MKISTDIGSAGVSENRSAGLGETTQSGAVQNSTSARSASYLGASPGDQVSLSGVSQLLQMGSSNRVQTLASLTSAVRGGSYQVSSLNVGQSMVSEMLARSGSQA